MTLKFDKIAYFVILINFNGLCCVCFLSGQLSLKKDILPVNNSDAGFI